MPWDEAEETPQDVSCWGAPAAAAAAVLLVLCSVLLGSRQGWPQRRPQRGHTCWPTLNLALRSALLLPLLSFPSGSG